ncbi:STAS domain-containing protein [Sphaerisporangium album]|nr:STAS domain-containing protein [Sphaerisporangium album]
MTPPRRLRIEGDLDRTALPTLSRVLAAMGNSDGIHVDLSPQVFIDVGCLRALMTAAGRLEGDHVLTLCSASPYLRRLLDLTGWHDTPHLRPRQPACPIHRTSVTP